MKQPSFWGCRDATHSHSQVVPVTVSTKPHLDQMEKLFSLPRSLVLFRILSLNVKRAIKVRYSQMNYISFFLQNFARPLILCKYSVYLRASLSSLSQWPVVAHFSACVLKGSLSAVHQYCLKYITSSEVCTWVLPSRTNSLHAVTETHG